MLELVNLYIIAATKGRGVHILKPGSKRRRTKTLMCVEEAEEDALHADSEARDSKIRDQYDHIQALEQ